MENDFSAIRSIQELKNLLDSGAITQTEYEALKRKVIFGNTPGGATTAPSSSSEPERAKPEPVQHQPDSFRNTMENNPAPVIPPGASVSTPSAPEPNSTIPPQYIRISELATVLGNKTRGDGVVEDTPVNQPGVNPLGANQPSLNQPTINRTEIHQPEEYTEVKRKDWLLTILITLGVLLLLGLIGYQLMKDQTSERLTSTSNPDSEEVIADNSAAIPASRGAAGVTPPDNITEGLPETTAPTPAAEPVLETPVVTTPAAPAVSETEALSKINNRLQEYYDDMKTAPFNASSHFAPTVERYYTLTNTTPAGINENINSFHFNEFQDSQSSIEEGSVKLTPLGADGFEVTYIEYGKAFRKSKNQNQETKSRVRARFNPDFKIVYFRQEQLLENKFTD